jgi:hypothetical protein
MIATDPLSLVFLGCFLFAAIVFVVLNVSGVGHNLHIGGHVVHAPGGAGHVHAQVHTAGHPAPGAHPAHHTSAHTVNGESAGSPVALRDTLLGAFNLYSILMFLLVFGLLGYLLRNLTHASAVVSFIVAIIVALVGGLGLGIALGRLFTTAGESVLNAETSRVEGRIAQVSVAIRPGGIGEVIYTRPGRGRMSIAARCVDDDAVPPGADVVILSYQDGIATVQPWDTFMTSVRAGTARHLESLDQHF